MIADSATAFLFYSATDILLISSSLLNIFMVSVLRCLDKKDEKKKGKILAFSFLYSCLLCAVYLTTNRPKAECSPSFFCDMDGKRTNTVRNHVLCRLFSL